MRCLRRILLNALTVLSLILCVATVALWVRSYWADDTFGWMTIRWSGPRCDTSAAGIDSDSGGILFYRLRRQAILRQDESFLTPPSSVPPIPR